ncbi:cell division cycle protein 27 homolog B-like isoform X2 [Asparagus officinalis]|uniref:cell division cycle protein 27 homolog B-like isoform X2 n=1 Tax=Asparagus officinalis TaxID=4686 RepID=UPI00098DE253|nr:cell division cycle protein 27 homolog B-like isoform X2 [Asparagus officinalis]
MRSLHIFNDQLLWFLPNADGEAPAFDESLKVWIFLTKNVEFKCAMGNCYSLLKDHETTLKNFLRAVQLDSRFAYAHTLCGHETLKHLEQVKDFTPCESSIYALMGKIHKRLNMHAKDMFYFGIALDLKPPASDVAAIKKVQQELNWLGRMLGLSDYLLESRLSRYY